MLTNPFSGFISTQFKFAADSERPLGISVSQCERLHRAVIADFDRHNMQIVGVSHRTAKRKFLGAYVVRIHGQAVYDPDDVDKVLDKLRRQRIPPEEVEVVLALERKTDFDDRDTPLHLQLDDIRHVCALRLWIPRI